MINQERREQREQRPTDDAEGGLACDGERPHVAEKCLIAGGEVLRHVLRGGATQTQVEGSDVAQDGPGQSEESKPDIAQRVYSDREGGDPDDERQAQPEDVVKRVAREPAAAHIRYFAFWAATVARIRSTGHCSTNPR